MRIGLNNIDTVIAEKIAERLCGPVTTFLSEEIDWSKKNRYKLAREEDNEEGRSRRKRRPDSREQEALALRMRRDDTMSKRGLTTFFALVLGGGAASGLLRLLPEGLVLPAYIGAGFLWMVGAAVGIRWTNRASQRHILNHEVTVTELEAVLPLLSLTRAERAYGDILLMVAALEVPAEPRRTSWETLAQVTGLLEDSRRLEKQRLSLLPVLGTNPVKELEAEQGKLEGRIAAAKDDRTREAIQQSLELVKTRAENSRTLEQALERLNAQQEALVHTLATAQSALARMQVMPGIQTEIATKEIAETVHAMNRQTVAVEQAVQELIAIRG